MVESDDKLSVASVLLRICLLTSSKRLDEIGAKIVRTLHSVASSLTHLARQAKKISSVPPSSSSFLSATALLQQRSILRMGKSFEVASSVNNSLFPSLLSSLSLQRRLTFSHYS